MCVHSVRYQHSSFPSAKQRAAPVVFSTLCHPVSVSSLQLLHALHRWAARLSPERNSVQPVFARTQSSCLEKMCWRILGKSLRHFENFRTEQRGHWLSAPPLLVFPTLLARSRSCPFEKSHKLVNLRVTYSPLGPQPVLRWERSTPAAVSLWADLVNRGAPDLHLVIEQVQAVGQVVHCAGAQWTTLFSWPLGSDTDVTAGGQRKRQEDVNLCFSFLRCAFST